MSEGKEMSLGTGDILNNSSKQSSLKSKGKPSQPLKPTLKDDEKLLHLAEIGKKAHVVRKEFNKNSYINIEQFFTERKIEAKYIIPFRIYMRHRTYQHSIEDFDRYFNKYLHRFDNL